MQKGCVIARNYNTHEYSPQINTQYKVAAEVINQLFQIHQVTQYSKLGILVCGVWSHLMTLFCQQVEGFSLVVLSRKWFTSNVI